MKKRNVVDKYKRWRSNARRNLRILFPSPAEMRLVELMGGKVFRIKHVRHYRTKFPLAFIYKQAPVFKAEQIHREYRVGKYFIDYANDIGRGVEVQGADYHRDVVKEFDRESYLYQRGWRILYIEATELYRQPDKVQQRVLAFLVD